MDLFNPTIDNSPLVVIFLHLSVGDLLLTPPFLTWVDILLVETDLLRLLIETMAVFLAFKSPMPHKFI